MMNTIIYILGVVIEVIIIIALTYIPSLFIIKILEFFKLIKKTIWKDDWNELRARIKEMSAAMEVK